MYFDIFHIIVFKRQIWIGASVRIRSPHLLWALHFLYCSSVQSLMDWSTVKLAPLSLCLLLLLFHDMPWASRYYRTVHSVAWSASIFKISVHLSLPRHIVVREWNIKACIGLLLSLMSCSKYLVWLESAISKRFPFLDCWVIILQRQTAIHDLALDHRLIVLLLQLL